MVVVVVVVRQTFGLDPTALRDEIGTDVVLLGDQTGECLPELAVVDRGIADVVNPGAVDDLDQVLLEVGPFETARLEHVHHESEKPSLPGSIEDQLTLAFGHGDRPAQIVGAGAGQCGSRHTAPKSGSAPRREKATMT